MVFIGPLEKASGKGAAHFVSFCDMGFSAFFCIFLFFLHFWSLILKKVEKGLQKVAKAEKAMPPYPFASFFSVLK